MFYIYWVMHACAPLSKERRNGVLNKVNSKGTLSSLASEEFRKLAKVCLEKDSKQGSRPDLRQQGPYTLAASVG